jgi:integrase
MLAPLRDDLLALKARRSPEPADLVLPTVRGTRQGKDNSRRWWTAIVDAANVRLAAQGYEPIATDGPGKLTPHAARRTFISAVLALGWDVGRVMDAVGHATAAMTLETYRRQIHRGDGALERLAVLYGGGSLRAPEMRPALVATQLAGSVGY